MVSFSLKDHICIHLLDNPAHPGQIKKHANRVEFSYTNQGIILCLFLEMILNISKCTNHVTWKIRIIVHKGGEQLQNNIDILIKKRMTQHPRIKHYQEIIFGRL